METMNFSQTSSLRNNLALSRAKSAIELPEVQAMLRRLSEFNLGIFMPHQHDEEIGRMLRKADQAVPFHPTCEGTFQRAGSSLNQGAQLPPLAWIWRLGALTPVYVCEVSAKLMAPATD